MKPLHFAKLYHRSRLGRPSPCRLGSTAHLDNPGLSRPSGLVISVPYQSHFVPFHSLPFSSIPFLSIQTIQSIPIRTLADPSPILVEDSAAAMPKTPQPQGSMPGGPPVLDGLKCKKCSDQGFDFPFRSKGWWKIECCSGQTSHCAWWARKKDGDDEWVTGYDGSLTSSYLYCPHSISHHGTSCHLMSLQICILRHIPITSNYFSPLTSILIALGTSRCNAQRACRVWPTCPSMNMNLAANLVKSKKTQAQSSQRQGPLPLHQVPAWMRRVAAIRRFI